MAGSVRTAAPATASRRTTTSRALGLHHPGLDGMRAVGMFVMLAYHADFPWARGAFLALSQFFTLSGFLITSMLLRTHYSTGGIDMGRFFSRRYRRLLPASFLTLAGVVVFAATIATEQQLETIPASVAASAAQVVNWYFVLTDTSYVDLFASPSPVQHFWSLAVEEQFYLIMPAGLYLLLRRSTSQKVIGAWFVGGALASTALMIGLYERGASLDRLYYGTDTRAAEVLVGGALAVLLHARPLHPSAAARRALGWAGAAAFAVTVWCWVEVPLTDGAIWQGGFLVFALLTATLITSIVTGAGAVTAFLGLGVVAAAGRITYGVYLFHWPLFLWLDEERTGLDQWPLFILRVTVTVGLAILSYHLFEMPIRNRSFAGVPGAVKWATAPVAALVVIVGAILVSDRNIDTDLAGLGEPSAAAPTVPADADLDVLVIGDRAGQAVTDRLATLDEASAELSVVQAAPFACEPTTEAGEPPACANWLQEWPELITEHDPDVVLFYVTRWSPEEIAAASGLTDPQAMEAWTADVLDSGFDLLTDAGAPVVWGRVPQDIATAITWGQEPFDQAMISVTSERSDLRRLVEPEIEVDRDVTSEAFVTEAADGLVTDLTLYRRVPATDLPRVLVIGDSVARTLGYGLERWAQDTGAAVVWSSGTEGCGIADEGLIRELAFREGPVAEPCTELAEGWRAQIAQFDPDVVIVLSTIWDVQERRLDDWPEYLKPGDEAFDSYLVDEYTAAYDILSSGGASVVWLKPPCARQFQAPGTGSEAVGAYSTERMTHLNEQILPRLAEARPDVRFFDMFALLCPAREFVDVAGGIETRPDGVHFSPDGSRWFADQYGEELLAASQG